MNTNRIVEGLLDEGVVGMIVIVRDGRHAYGVFRTANEAMKALDEIPEDEKPGKVAILSSLPTGKWHIPAK